MSRSTLNDSHTQPHKGNTYKIGHAYNFTMLPGMSCITALWRHCVKSATTFTKYSKCLGTMTSQYCDAVQHSWQYEDMGVANVIGTINHIHPTTHSPNHTFTQPHRHKPRQRYIQPQTKVISGSSFTWIS